MSNPLPVYFASSGVYIESPNEQTTTSRVASCFCPHSRHVELMVNQGAKSRLSRLREIPRAVWALGFVSLLMDTSSEIIHALLPVYLVTALGASMVTVGFIEGIAEATASITKVFSGAISDWLGKRKLLAVIGYGLAALTKPIFPLAPSVGWLFAARFI